MNGWIRFNGRTIYTLEFENETKNASKSFDQVTSSERYNGGYSSQLISGRIQMI